MANGSADWVGRQLAGGRYHVTERLGAGGMGFVYRAHDTNLGCDVVIKAPRPEVLNDAEFSARFTREIRALVRLAHPHVVRVLDVGAHEAVPFAVLQYLSGGSLRARQPRRDDGQARPMPPQRLRDWLPQIAAALDLLHVQRHVHRDVKPDNILFDAQGHAYLGDFGIVKVLADDAHRRKQTVMTNLGTVLGTPQYMAPELLLARRYDGRVDQYALAVLVYELLAGRYPFDGARPNEIFEAHLTRTPTPLEQLAPGLPAEVAAAVRRGMAREPDRRFPDCDAFARAVVEHLGTAAEGPAVACPHCGQKLRPPAAAAGKAVQCPACHKPLRVPGATPKRVARPAGKATPRRRRLVWAAVAAGLLVAAGAGAFATGLFGGKEEPPPPVAQVKTPPEDRKLGADGGAKEKQPVAVPRPADGLKQAKADAAPPQQKTPPEIKPLDLPPKINRPPRRDKEGPPDVKAPDPAPPNKPPPAPAKPALVLDGHTETLGALAFSPDGKYALTGGGPLGRGAEGRAEGCELRLWDLASGEEVRQFSGHTGRVAAVAFSPDGRLAVSGAHDKTARVWDVATGRELRRFSGHTWGVHAVAFSPGGRYVLSAGGDHRARLWDVQTGVELRTFAGHKSTIEAVAFSPDGRRALTGSWDRTARLWDVVSGAELRRLEGHTDFVRAVAFSPDGKHALTGTGANIRGNQWVHGTDHGLRLWDLADGTQKLRLPADGHIVRWAGFSPDGKQALSGGEDGLLRVWDLAAGKALSQHGEPGRTWVVAAAPGPDGRCQFGTLGGRTVRIWRTEVAAPALAAAKAGADPDLARDVFEGHKEAVLALALSADGKLAATAGGGTNQHPRGSDFRVLIWSPGGAVARSGQFAGHTDVVKAAAFSPTDPLLATAGHDGRILLWSLSGPVQARTLTPAPPQPTLGAVSALAFTPDGKYLLSAGSHLFLWDVATGTPVHRFPTSVFLHSVAVSPTGALALTGAIDGTVHLWSLKTKGAPRRLVGPRDKICAVGFFPDGKRAFAVSGWKLLPGKLVFGEDDAVRVWDLTDRKAVLRLQGKDGPFESGALSPDGRLVVTGGFDGSVRVWDLQAGREVAAFRGHTGAVQAVAFLPDGRRLLSASRDSTVRLWRLPDGVPAP